MSASETGARVRSDAIPAQAWKALALVSASMFAIILDNNAANVAFPFIERTFPDTPRSTLAWVSTGYAIAAAALLLVAGRLADRYGRRRIFLVGMAVFMVASTTTALAPNPAVLIFARLVQGAGAALLTSTAVALLLPEFPPNKRGLALGVWGTVGSSGAAAGPTLGALAIEAYDWRLVFLLNTPLAIATLTLGRRMLRPDPPVDTSGGITGGIDLGGTVVGTASIAMLTFAILQGPRWGWASGTVLGLLVAAAVLLGAFLWRCARAAAPLLDLGLFGYRTFATANLSQAGTQMAIFAWFFTTPLFLINVWHYSAFAGGTAVAIGMVASFVSIPVGHWSDRHGYRGVLIAGGLVVVASMLWWLVAVESTPNYWTGYFPGLVIFGVGAGMVGIVVTNAALAGLPEANLASANAAFQTIRRLVGAIGVALSVAILGGRDSDSLNAFRGTWLLIGCGYLFSVIAIL
ncbi:MAG: DHA2 family efflux MFS transporter permease subunit, partial [Acidimicrobiia bacterium]|nr:DHA2 family efflux MFS transporter permease subunit [Acidimicrobiia bacterium]